MRKLLFASSLVLAMAIPILLTGHEGHEHKVMGTVTAVHEGHVQVKTSEGKTEDISLTSDTKYVMGKVNATVADLKVGTRVVVSIKETAGRITATLVRLGEAKKAATKKASPHAKKH